MSLVTVVITTEEEGTKSRRPSRGVPRSKMVQFVVDQYQRAGSTIKVLHDGEVVDPKATLRSLVSEKVGSLYLTVRIEDDGRPKIARTG
jgi:hypothetical protein